jgi:hypothetical protein
VEFLEDRGGEWEGIPSDLLAILQEEEFAGLPGNAQHLTRPIQKVSERYAQVCVERKRTTKQRTIRLELVTSSTPIKEEIA